MIKKRLNVKSDFTKYAGRGRFCLNIRRKAFYRDSVHKKETEAA